MSRKALLGNVVAGLARLFFGFFCAQALLFGSCHGRSRTAPQKTMTTVKPLFPDLFAKRGGHPFVQVDRVALGPA
jgi:hypothetical protein